MKKPDVLPSALPTYDEWVQLEASLFDEGGVMLERVRDYARSNGLYPVPFLVAVLLQTACCVPPEVKFKTVFGIGSLNLFAVLLGAPGSGKDRTMSHARQVSRVFRGEQQFRPRVMEPSSGEGLLKALNDPDNNRVLFNAGEVGTLHARMQRQGSTLRGVLLNAYSGNAMGAATRNDALSVEAHAYRCGLWVGAQPEKAHVLVAGADDGFRHRFIWCEVMDPLIPDHPPSGTIEVPKVSIPACLWNKPITFPEEVNVHIRDTEQSKAYGLSDGVSGHRNLTRLKVAATLCIMRSDHKVDMADWHRAGVLLTYSDKVQARVMSFAHNQQVMEEAERLERRNEAQELVADRRAKKQQGKRNKMIRRMLDGLNAVDDGQPAPSVSTLTGRIPNRDRAMARQLLEELGRDGVVRLLDGRNGGQVVERGQHFHDYLDRLPVSDD